MNTDHACGGALRSDCPWYVQRRKDKTIFELLVRGENCYVLTSHQMGKSSLVVRLADKLRTAGLATVVIDLSAFGSELNCSQWYNALSQRVGRQLHLEEEFDTFWVTQTHLSPPERFFAAVDQIAFTTGSSRLIFLIDEIDLLRSLPFSTDQFLGVIQSAAMASGPKRPGHNCLVFCLLGTVPQAMLWREPNSETSQLGKVVALHDFERKDLRETVNRLAGQLLESLPIAWVDRLYTPQFILDQILDRTFHWTNGQPYLTQKLGCTALLTISHQLWDGADIMPAQCQELVDRLCDTLFTSPDAREQDCHFLWIRQHLLSRGWNASLHLDLCQRIECRADLDASNTEDSQRWLCSGIVRVQDGRLEWRNRVYERVFDSPWLLRCLGPKAASPSVHRARIPTRQESRFASVRMASSPQIWPATLSV